MGALSRAFSTMALAAAAIPADVLALVGDEPVEGLRGNGGGARSGSELSHLRLIAVSKVMMSECWHTCQVGAVRCGIARACVDTGAKQSDCTHMGTLPRPSVRLKECLWPAAPSRSLEASLSCPDMMCRGPGWIEVEPRLFV